MENIAYYVKQWAKVPDGSIPCYLLDFLRGPVMSVYGTVNIGDEGAVCEPLDLSYPLLYFENNAMMTALIRVFASLKKALRELKTEYKSRVPYDVQRARYPYKDTAIIDGNEVKIRYTGTVYYYVFTAMLEPSQQPVIAKFAMHYGSDVHDYSAEQGFTPKLLYHEVLVNGWVFVVMERLTLTSLDKAPSVSVVKEQVDSIKTRLAAKSFVHGDLLRGTSYGMLTIVVLCSLTLTGLTDTVRFVTRSL